MAHRRQIAWLASLVIAGIGLTPTTQAAEPDAPPFPTIPGRAFHLLPQTHNNESGYFSLCIGADGDAYVGTAKYGVNAFLVRFHPADESQRIVIDTHQLCGLTDTGYAAQAKIHTRNFVGPSGVVYVGSKQGYPTEQDKKDNVQYPGGYVMTYNPATGQARNLGMPMATEGIIDVVADESRNLLYAVTCENQHWMVSPIDQPQWQEIGPLLTPYATTLVDAAGVARAITADFQIAQYDPATQQATVRPVELDSQGWTRAGRNSIPYWILDPDGRHAWVVLMNDPTLIRMDLSGTGPVAATAVTKLIDGDRPDTRSGMTLGPDGNIYLLFRTANKTGYGEKEARDLHHLIRFDPRTSTVTDLGVPVVANPDWFDFTPGPGPDGKHKPWTQGFPQLPNGMRTNTVPHMGIAVGADGTLWVTLLYPYTLVKLPAIAAGTVRSR